MPRARRPWARGDGGPGPGPGPAGGGGGGGARPEGASPLRLGLCKFWLNTGRCPRGPGCAWAHPDMQLKENRRLRELWVRARRAEKLCAQRLEGDPHSATEKARKGERAEVFCEWLLATFPGLAAAPGGGDKGGGAPVLDIAGGRGEVTFGLAVRRGVPCVLVDPRPAGWPDRLTKHQRHYLRLLAKREKKAGGRMAGEGARDGPPPSSPLAALRQLVEYFDADFCARHLDEVRGAPVLCGMHPDEATEALVDAAVRYRRPFAVVPCCVFPADGVARTFEAWTVHLRAKSPAIRSAFLPFSGRNQVLFVEDAAKYGESEPGGPGQS